MEFENETYETLIKCLALEALGTKRNVSGPETLRAGLEALYTISVAKESSDAAGFDLSRFQDTFSYYAVSENRKLRTVAEYFLRRLKENENG